MTEDVKKEAAVSEGVEGEDLTAELEASRTEAKEHYDKLLRIMAEFENFKKRIAREQSDHLKYGNERLIKSLIPVIDDFERALDHIPKSPAKDVKAIADGMELVHKNLMKALAHFGLKRIETKGACFDPALHEAISCVSSKEHACGEIIEVHRKGYLLHDRLLRAAAVTIAKGDE